MQLNTTIAICIGIIFILIGFLCLLNNNTRSIMRKVLAAIFFIIGAINIICPIACNTMGTETKTNTKHDIYEIDNKYITWTGSTNNIANVYVKKNNEFERTQLLNADFGYCAENETAYYEEIKIQKTFLFYTITDVKYIIYTPPQ